MKRHLSLVLVAAVLVVCLVGAIVAGVAAGSGFSPVAYRVNGDEVSQATVDRELKWLAGNSSIEQSLQQQGQTLTNSDGSISAGVTATWLSQRIQVDLLRQGAAKKGVKVAVAERNAARKQVAHRYPHAPSSALGIVVDGSAYANALGLTTQQAQAAFFQSAVRKADVAIDPRYGRWNPAVGVCPPTGCPTTAGG